MNRPQEHTMPDLNGWPLACIALMVTIIVINHLIENGPKK